MRLIQAGLVILLLGNCDGFVGEVSVDTPLGPPIAVVDADYVILRPVTTAELTNSKTATAYGQTLYFRQSERILDLRHLDLRTAKIEQNPTQSGTFAVSLATTRKGVQLPGAWTSANVGKQLGVFLDNRLISAPVIKSPITTLIVLDGDFTKAQAESVVSRLRRGGRE